MVGIRLEDLTKEFNTPSGIEKAVDNLDLSIEHGEFFTFVGPSGCGKTTTLRMIAGLETATSGHIYFDDEEVTDLPPQQRDIAMVFQNVALYPHMTNYENIGYGLKIRGEMENYDQRIHEVAELLEIGDLLDKKPGQLSGGQKQRVALGRGIIRDPNVILLDEPMSDLDAKLKASLRVEVQRIHKNIDTTIIYVTHDQNEAMTMSDRIALMNGGRLEQVGAPEDIFHSPDTEFASRFIGQPSMNFIDARLDGGELSFENGHSIRVDEDIYARIQDRLSTSSDEVRLGFRPRHVILSDDSSGVFPLEVDVWEPIGAEYVVHLIDEAGNEIQVISEDSEFEYGKTVWVKEITTWYAFDPETGKKLCQLGSIRAQDVPAE